MKAGLTASVAAHILVLGWGLISLSSPAPFHEEYSEPLPIELVPISDKMSVQKGDATAKKAEKSKEKETKNTESKPEAKNIGEGQLDTKAPLKPKEKPRIVDTPPPPSGASDGKPAVSEPIKPQDKPPQEAAKPTPPTTKTEQAAEPVVQPKAEKPKPQQAEENPDIAKTQAEPEKDPMPKLPEKAPLPMAKPVEQKPTAPKPKGEDSLDKILAESDKLLIDKTKTQGGGARSSTGPAAFGGRENYGNEQQLAQTFGNIISSCVKSNFDAIAIGGGMVSDLKIQAQFKLNSDGSLKGNAVLHATGGDNRQQEIGINQANAAIIKCSPFPLPADKYGMWGDIEMVFDPFENM